MAEGVTITDAMRDPNLFGDTFGGETWAAWRALLAGFYGLPLDDDATATWRTLTERRSTPQGAFRELWLPVGRRGGKSRVAALVAVYEAAFKDHSAALAPGEVATVMLLAADRRQARTLMRYVSGLIDGNPMLARMKVRETSEGIELANRSVIEVHTASFRAVRGYTLACVVADEIAFWHVEGLNPDREIMTALRPALATLDGKLLALSSPYAKRGELWRQFKLYHGTDDPEVLVARAPSRVMNPTLSESVVQRAMREDREAALSEYGAEFRADISQFLDEEIVEAAQRPKPRELPPVDGTSYVAFVDPAGGGADGFGLAIGHLDGDAAVLDLVREQKGSPAEIVAEYAGVLKGYGIWSVTGDRYAGRWPRDEFRRHGISYEVLELLARMNSGQVELPPGERLRRQLVSLERRTSRAGRDMIDHGPGGHDDLANAAAGVVTLCKKARAKSETRRVKGLI
jgi:hypothetical protein